LGLTIKDVVATNCSGLLGGAVSSERTPLTITDSIFTSNTATEGGGALYIQTPENVIATLSGCAIYSNVATNNGGGVFLLSDYISITHTNITNNNASLGGGVYLQSDRPNREGSYDFNSTLIANNTAKTSGGGLYSSNLNHTWNIFGAVFQDNISPEKVDPNVACYSNTSIFCYFCIASDCASDCPASANQSCSLLTASSANCYSNEFDTCSATGTCSCNSGGGLTGAAKILIVLISLCLFIGIVLIVADVVRHFYRKKQRGYHPIK